MDENLGSAMDRYAALLVRNGVNLQEGQSLRIVAELEHAELVRLVTAHAYQAGARYVHVDWSDTPTTKQRLLHSRREFLDYLPDYEVERHRYMTDHEWARLSLAGPEFPDIFADTDPNAMRRVTETRGRKLKFYMEAMMADRMQWCVAGAPTRAWARQVYPDLSQEDALAQLWRTVLHVCRADQPDPVAAWRAHSEAQKRVIDFLSRHAVRSVRFVDPTPAEDGRPVTDLTVGLTDRPAWVGAAAVTPRGVQFLPNMPTEEVFSTPHRQRTQGWVRVTKPAFPFMREVNGIYVRFVDGEVVEYRAEDGQETLDQLFALDGARRLGEVALVDVRSPINQAGVVFYETLFDENAVCHIAFGQAYPGGVDGGADLPPDELDALGVNRADTHLDVMIGSEAMDVYGTCADGSVVQIMERGRFASQGLEQE